MPPIGVIFTKPFVQVTGVVKLAETPNTGGLFIMICMVLLQPS